MAKFASFTALIGQHTRTENAYNIFQKEEKNDFTTSVRNSRNGNSRLKHPLSNFIPWDLL
jgi:hypothetical protein